MSPLNSPVGPTRTMATEATSFRLGAALYKEGDTWYRDMRSPGFDGESAPNPDNSLQWLAERLVADERFGEATVKFWWPAIMGGEVAVPPEESRMTPISRVCCWRRTRMPPRWNGWQGDSGAASVVSHAWNLKDLLVEIVLSKWFRAEAFTDDGSGSIGRPATLPARDAC